MNPADTPVPHSRKTTRSTLACLPCRSRHTKCDGKRPQCSRCADFAKDCFYAESRRGGVNRGGSGRKMPNDTASLILDVLDNSLGSQTPSIGAGGDSRLEDGGRSSRSNDQSTISSPASPRDPKYRIESDLLVDLYYQNFHKFHPLVLPQKFLIRAYGTPEGKAVLEPLVAVLRLLGNIYGTHTWSTILRDYVDECLEVAPMSPTVVQSKLIYSIALFWYDHKEDAQVQMDAATQIAVSLNMCNKEFATANAGSDPVLAESWRRTWWMLYIIDTYLIGTMGTRQFTVENIEANVDLPCEESEYESGVSLRKFYNCHFIKFIPSGGTCFDCNPADTE